MPIETGPVSVEMLREALVRYHQRTGVQIFVGALDDTAADDLNSVLAPTLAAERALAVALDRQQAADVIDAVVSICGRNPDWERGNLAGRKSCSALLRSTALPIPDADLRELLECAIEAGRVYQAAWLKWANGPCVDGTGPKFPTYESVLHEYIERSRAK